MNQTSDDKTARPERLETDTSLRAERDKTDEELVRRNAERDGDADQVIQLARIARTSFSSSRATVLTEPRASILQFPKLGSRPPEHVRMPLSRTSVRQPTRSWRPSASITNAR